MKLEELVIENCNRLNENDLLIWKYIQKHKKECCEIAIEDLAKKCSISRTTISRFTKKLSFDGFREFKVHLKMEYNEELTECGVIIDDGYHILLPDFRCLLKNSLLKKAIDAGTSGGNFFVSLLITNQLARLFNSGRQ
ncbi:hypothetical protein GCM10008910_02760 [Faecalicatena orotica]|uniref:RpiR family transcriptional regulator n=1 Tax=Faecalicatena orotica TaxID=1544 RepID=A0A2Y9BKW4_9FIRM|nr:MurR/RpiR family transcriptional regulator [Faecalicatena orotica]PWJ28590.1 RpiR family transcriptional regulator [Faecalicatena orotica]SSA56411.1 transcriptional regulator, RpiR family [Faecalicatena orotica]